MAHETRERPGSAGPLSDSWPSPRNEFGEHLHGVSLAIAFVVGLMFLVPSPWNTRAFSILLTASFSGCNRLRPNYNPALLMRQPRVSRWAKEETSPPLPARQCSNGDGAR